MTDYRNPKLYTCSSKRSAFIRVLTSMSKSSRTMISSLTHLLPLQFSDSIACLVEDRRYSSNRYRTACPVHSIRPYSASVTSLTQELCLQKKVEEQEVEYLHRSVLNVAEGIGKSKLSVFAAFSATGALEKNKWVTIKDGRAFNHSARKKC